MLIIVSKGVHRVACTLSPFLTAWRIQLFPYTGVVSPCYADLFLWLLCCRRG